MKHTLNIFLIIIISVAVFILSLCFGSSHYSLNTVAMSLFQTDLTIHSHQVLYEIRFPRVMASLCAGAMLSISGLILQTTTHNNLSDSSILGINAGANLSIVIATLIIPSISFLNILIFGFVGGLMIGLIVLLITRSQSSLHLILAGAGISLFIYAITDFVIITNDLGQYIAFFTAGGASGQRLSNYTIILPLFIIVFVILQILSKELDIFLHGDEMSISLGQNTKFIKIIAVICAIILASIAVAMVGNVVFIGLLVPHITKMLYGYKHCYNLILTGILGGTLFMLCDMFSRIFNEIPVNAIIAVIGLPIFILIIRRRESAYED